MRKWWGIWAISLLLVSCHVGRYFVYNFANLSDHKKFQNETIEAASPATNWDFFTAEKSANISFDIKGAQQSLDQLNEDHKSVAFLIIRRDTILYEWYRDTYDSSSLLTSFSMAKSYVSALVGIAIEEGHIKNIQEPITNYIKDFKHPGFEKITIEHVLNMRTGIDYEENYKSPFGNVAIAYYGRNLDRHLGQLKIKQDPDEKFEYISIATQILGTIVENATGKTLAEYCEEKIWQQIGTTYGASWSLDRKEGRTKAFCCLNARARDYAKFGRLYLRDGHWNGKQIVPKDWVQKSTEKGNWSKDHWYGYQWWHEPQYENNAVVNNHFYMQGHLGQFVYMDPSKDIILLRIGKNYGGVSWTNLMEQLCKKM